VNRFVARCATVWIAASMALCAVASAAEGPPVRNIFLTDARDIADAKAVNRALDVVSGDAATCRRSGGGAKACACRPTAGLRELRSAVDTAVARHPRWNADDTFVNYADPATGLSVATSLPGLARQLASCTKR
jgi:hypothetical protein